MSYKTVGSQLLCTAKCNERGDRDVIILKLSTNEVMYDNLPNVRDHPSLNLVLIRRIVWPDRGVILNDLFL